MSKIVELPARNKGRLDKINERLMKEYGHLDEVPQVLAEGGIITEDGEFIPMSQLENKTGIHGAFLRELNK